MIDDTGANLRLAEIAHQIKQLELEVTAIQLEQAEIASLEGHDNWLSIASSATIWADYTAEPADKAARQKIRRLAESGKVTARRAKRRDGQPGKLWQINQLSLTRFLEGLVNGVNHQQAQRAQVDSV
tara:strand:- start:535 stop:915 length:381 start_codon:yes stop_codon:yes gene_type:complete